MVKKNRFTKKVNFKDVSKLILFVLIVFLLFYNNILNFFKVDTNTHNNSYDEFENEIKLLAVTQNDKGEIFKGSMINLDLKKVKGNGEIYFQANSFIEIDTQISIREAHKTTCQILELECEKYDFFYSFENNLNLIKGPSAGTSISYLLYKTINNEKTQKDISLTGAVYSGGIVGQVGGVEEKIELSQANNIKKIFIPKNSIYNKSKNYSIEIVEILDIEEFKNTFSSENYSKKFENISTEIYVEDMKSLAQNLCYNEKNLFEKINKNNLTNNSKSFIENYIEEKNQTNNLTNNDYYSIGSFCFSNNLNLRKIYEEQNFNNETLNLKLKI